MRTRITCLIAAFLISSAPAATLHAGVDAKVHAFVSIPPQAYFVERIGGPYVAVDVMVPPGQSPHSFEPLPKQIATLSRADAYFQIGMTFEGRLIAKAQEINPRLKVFDTRKGIALHQMAAADEHGHGQGMADPHIWLSPKLAKIQATNISAALCQLDPAHAADFQKNLASFIADLDRVDASIALSLAALKGDQFFVYHPAFWYFGDAYGLKQVAVESSGKEPSARELGRLIDRAKAAGVRVIFVQPQFPTKSAEAVAAAIGGSVIKIDDLSRDYLANLETIASRIKEGLRAK
ncbi:MAG: zinc ABC transporter substrate-binding protein [bacterium]